VRAAVAGGGVVVVVYGEETRLESEVDGGGGGGYMYVRLPKSLGKAEVKLVTSGLVGRMERGGGVPGECRIR
jgi:hypothetical protein